MCYTVSILWQRDVSLSYQNRVIHHHYSKPREVAQAAGERKMAGISRYEKIALGATAVFAVFCAAVLLGEVGSDRPYEVSAAPVRIESGAAQAEGAPDSLLPGEKIDLNSAPAKELERLPGIGESKAADIVEYRAEFGPFACIEDITKVPGIGAGTLDSLRDYIIVNEG